jgi:hypothetical protein
LLDVSIGQDLFAGFMPLANITDYFGALPPLFVHSWQYDQGASFRWTGFTEGSEKAWSMKGSIINGDGGFGMTKTATKSFHNSSPGLAFTAEVCLFHLFGASEEFIKTFGEFSLETSVVKDDRGSYPKAKRPADQLLAGIKWAREIFGHELALRGSVGELERGLTDFPTEKTEGWVVEAAVKDIKCGKSALTPYAYLSNFEYVSGHKGELWLPGTSYQNQWGLGLKLDRPFGWKNVYFSEGCAFRDFDGENKWRILDNSDVYFFSAGFAF